MKRVHESVDYIKHRDAKQLFSLTEEVGKMDIRAEDSLLDAVHALALVSYRIVKEPVGAKYTTYLVRVYAGGDQWEVSRRYNEFRHLNDALLAAGMRNLPALPPKKMFGGFSSEFLEHRRRDLEDYLRSLLRVPSAAKHPSFRKFLLDQHAMLMPAEPSPSHKAAPRTSTSSSRSSTSHQHQTSLSHELEDRFDEGDESASTSASNSAAALHLSEMADMVDVSEGVFYSPMSAPLDEEDENESIERRSSTDNSSTGEENTFRSQNVAASGASAPGSAKNAAAHAAPGRPPVHPGRAGPASRAEGATANDASTEYKPKLDDFEFIRVLGKGSFGKVTLCRKRDSSQLFAMKALKKGHIIKRKQVAHTKTERSVLGQVNHPFIVRLHYAFQSSDKLYFVLDYCSGGELFFHLGRAGRFSEDLGRFYAAEIALALGCLHSMGVVYRDLKPENILLDSDGHLKIADFGLSKEGIAEAVRGTHSFCGTPEYLAPEVLNRTGHGSAVDWWSLGALLFEMLTGLPPWYSQDRQRMFASIRSSELRFPDYLSAPSRHILADFLQRDVTTRLGSARDIAEVMEHPFFLGVNFDALYRKQVRPPFVPNVRSQTDTDNFDTAFTRLPVNSIVSASPQPPHALSASMSEEPLFDGFTYIEQSSLMQHMRGRTPDHHRLMHLPHPGHHQPALHGQAQQTHNASQAAPHASQYRRGTPSSPNALSSTLMFE